MTDEDSEFRKYGRQLFKPTFRLLIVNTLGMISPQIPRMLKIQHFLPDVIDFFVSTFKEIITYREKNAVTRNDVAQTLMQDRKELVFNNDSIPEDIKYYSNKVYIPIIIIIAYTIIYLFVYFYRKIYRYRHCCKCDFIVFRRC